MGSSSWSCDQLLKKLGGSVAVIHGKCLNHPSIPHHSTLGRIPQHELNPLPALVARHKLLLLGIALLIFGVVLWQAFAAARRTRDKGK
jgi:hypothetical protein